MGGGGEVAEDAATVVGGVDELALKKYHGAVTVNLAMWIR